MKYPKINSVWKRVEQKGKLIEGDFSIPEFANIKMWLVQEKIDGMNIRVSYEASKGSKFDLYYKREVNGRNEHSLIPKKLEEHLSSTLDLETLNRVFLNDKKEEDRPLKVILFGEGYGPTIQKGGGNYRKQVGFILFDVYVDGWWLQQIDVKDIATRLNIPYAPIIGGMTTEQVVEYVKSKPMSLCSVTPQVMEGVICRPNPLMLLRNGDPLIMKLKCKDV